MDQFQDLPEAILSHLSYCLRSFLVGWTVLFSEETVACQPMLIYDNKEFMKDLVMIFLSLVKHCMDMEFHIE